VASLYLNESLDEIAFATGRRLGIDGADARHAAQVARVRTGERIGIGDGRGRIGWGPVVHVASDSVAIEVEEVLVEAPAVPELWLVQALAKGDRDELAVQAATELGASGVVPWQAARSVSRWSGPKAAKAAKGVERWRSIVREAAKQAIRPSVPEVAELATTAGLAERLRVPGVVGLVLEPSASHSLTAVLEPPATAAIDRIELIVGPEGGIDPLELRELELAGARVVRLGAEVLRTSTAGPAALATLAVLLRRW